MTEHSEPRIEDGGSGIEGQGSGIEVQGSEIEDRGSRIEDRSGTGPAAAAVYRLHAAERHDVGASGRKMRVKSVHAPRPPPTTVGRGRWGGGGGRRRSCRCCESVCGLRWVEF